MPTYEFRCEGCDKEFDVVIRISELDETQVVCEKCNIAAIREFRTPANMSIPTHMQAAPNMSKKEKARVPINIIDELPNGGCRVTRIGKKSDIDNE